MDLSWLQKIDTYLFLCIRDIIYENGIPYLYGGAIRDNFLKTNAYSDDLDFVITNFDRDNLYKILKRYYQNITIHSKFSGTFTVNNNISFSIPIVLENGELVEDKNSSIIEHLDCCDFTINSCALNLINNRYINLDLMIEDIERKEIKLNEIYIYKNSLMSCYHFVIRSIYIASKINFNIEKNTYDILFNNVENMFKYVDPLYLKHYTHKIISSNYSSYGIQLLDDFNMLNRLLDIYTDESITK